LILKWKGILQKKILHNLPMLKNALN